MTPQRGALLTLAAPPAERVEQLCPHERRCAESGAYCPTENAHRKR